MEDQGILLRAGTNELEVLGIILGTQYFGINALKVLQIIPYKPEDVTHLPGPRSSMLGTLLFQDNCISLVDLKAHIHKKEVASKEYRQVVLITEFNKQINGFLIDGVDQIYRVSWEKIHSPSPLLTAGSVSQVTGIVTIDNHEVIMLDFEKIVREIGANAADDAEDTPDISAVPELQEQRRLIKIMVSEDSKLIRTQITKKLKQANYTDVESFENGKHLYLAIQALIARARQENRPVTDYLIIIITDIEMPGMDGLTLCKAIKAEVPEVHVLILSSMISEQMALKCSEVHADAYLSKKDIQKLIQVVDELCL
ncbi:chemotaxis protein [Deltaproteobacteria bacterium TL4]